MSNMVNMNMLRSIRLFILTVIVSFFAVSSVMSQGRIGYSLDTIMRRLDSMHLMLNRINDFQGQAFDTRKVEQQMPEIRSSLQIISGNSSPSGNVPDIKNLQLFSIMLNTIRQELEQWRSSLFRYNNDLIRMNSEIGAFTKDSVIRQLVSDSLYRIMYMDELNTLRQKWEVAGRSTQANLSRINRLQSEVSEAYFQTIDLRSRVDLIKKQLTGKLFTREYPYIWESEGSIDSSVQATRIAARNYRGQQGVMGYYIRTNWDYYLFVLAIGALFFFWVWRNFRRLPTPPGGLRLQYLHPIPILSSLVVMLNIIPFFDLDAPALYTQLIQMILLVVLSIIFRGRWPRRYFYQWILIAVLFLLFSGTGAFLVPLMNIRIMLLGLNIVSATLGYRAARRVTKVVCFPQTVRIVSIIYLALNILAVICNVFGRLTLAKTFSSAAIFGLVQIIGLSVFIESLLETLTLQGAIVKARNPPGKHAFVFDRMRKGLFRILLIFSIFTWLTVFAINLNVYDTIYRWLRHVYNLKENLGSISFRLGNLFIFIIIIYLSNLLQKYVGYLFGATEEQAMPEGGKKGSRLVMTRLILIICGFLLAVGASGLPIDKITIVLGALGVGIGLGLQTIVNSLVSGIILIFERPFQIGDYIELNGKKGIVRDIGIRSSRLVTEEGTEIIMPNGDLLAGEVINYTVRNSQVKIEISMAVEVGHSFEEITHIVHEALDGQKDLSGENKPRILLSTATEKSTSFTVSVWVANISQIQTIKSEVLSLLYQKFREKGIKTM